MYSGRSGRKCGEGGGREEVRCMQHGMADMEVSGRESSGAQGSRHRRVGGVW